MTDEKFTFIQDVKEKKHTARSAFNKRTHCGSGGAIKFPSDYLTKKELQSMNSEITTYRMNDPLTWQEFNAMPDDIKVLYIKAIRQRYNSPVLNIAEMMGVHAATLRKELARLNISGKQGKPGKWDKEGYLAWWKGVPAPAKEETFEDVCIPVPEIKMIPKREEAAIPCSGTMTFSGSADTALETVRTILGGGGCNNHGFVGNALRGVRSR